MINRRENRIPHKTLRSRYPAIALHIVLMCAILLPSVTRADTEGCAVKMCVSTNWKTVDVCKPIVENAIKKAWKGKGWPICSEYDQNDKYEAAYAPGNCPAQYTYTWFEGDANIQRWGCTMKSVVRNYVEQQPWSFVWIDLDDNTSTEYFPAALSQLPPEYIDPRFAEDYTKWFAVQPPPAPPPRPDTPGGT